MKSTPSHPEPTEGLYFALGDLQAALAWAADLPGVRLLIMTDHAEVPEAIEIYPPGASVPHWCIWRDYSGRLRVDNWSKPDFDLPYQTLAQALSFIGSTFTSRRQALG